MDTFVKSSIDDSKNGILNAYNITDLTLKQ